MAFKFLTCDFKNTAVCDLGLKIQLVECHLGCTSSRVSFCPVSKVNLGSHIKTSSVH